MSFMIRRATLDDAAGVTRVYEDPSAYSGTLQLPYPAVSQWRERIAAGDQGTVLLVACSGDEIVGSLGLHLNLKTPRRTHAGGLGMAVPTSWQRKGVGSALLGAAIDLADNWYGLARLELTVYTDNTAALALYQKLGFAIEGTLRAYALRNGVLADTYTMARIRPRPSP